MRERILIPLANRRGIMIALLLELEGASTGSRTIALPFLSGDRQATGQQAFIENGVDNGESGNF